MIVVDVGNTNINFARIKDKKILRLSTIPTAKVNKAKIKKVILRYKAKNILVCSVVPKVSGVFKALNRKVFLVGKDIKVPIKSFYDKKKIGNDRLVGVYAAKILFPQTRLILDFGTATTLDFLSKQGDYQGGIILPGIGATLRALSGCALLPKKIVFQKSKKLVPTTTQESISLGIEKGFSLMINSLVKEYKKKLKISKEKIIITGGQAKIIIPGLKFPYKYEPLLVLKGLAILAEMFYHSSF